MTDEAQGPAPEDTPAPPASTRWSEDAVQDDDAVAPPFVPGRGAAARTGESAAELAPEPVSEGAPEPVGAPEPEIERASVRDLETERAGEEAFPFEAHEDAREEELPPEPPAPPEDDFPFDQFDIEGEGEEAPTEEPFPYEGGYATDPAELESASMGWSPDELGLEEAPEPESGAEPEPEPLAEAQPEPLAEPQPESLTEPQPEAIPHPEAEPTAPAAVGGAAEDAAAILDRLAGLLRTEGEEAVRREMDSPDRLTAVLAGLLAGYVSGRS